MSAATTLELRNMGEHPCLSIKLIVSSIMFGLEHDLYCVLCISIGLSSTGDRSVACF